MSEESMFFDNIDGDREYNAEQYSEYFRQILTTGVLGTGDNLKVYATGDDRIARVKVGYAWIEGRMYHLKDSELELPLDEAHDTYDRVDRIVLRLDTTSPVRTIEASVKTGEPATTPIPPDLTREGKVYEISLAQIKIPHNTTVIIDGNITDERKDPSVCGVAHYPLHDEEEKDLNELQEALNSHENLTTTAHGGIVPSSDVVTAAMPNKILKLNNSGELDADIAGTASNSDHLEGRPASNFMLNFSYATKKSGSVNYDEKIKANDVIYKEIITDDSAAGPAHQGVIRFRGPGGFILLFFTRGVNQVVGVTKDQTGFYSVLGNESDDVVSGDDSMPYGPFGKATIGLEQIQLQGGHVDLSIKNYGDTEAFLETSVDWQVWG